MVFGNSGRGGLTLEQALFPLTPSIPFQPKNGKKPRLEEGQREWTGCILSVHFQNLPLKISNGKNDLPSLGMLRKIPLPFFEFHQRE